MTTELIEFGPFAKPDVRYGEEMVLFKKRYCYDAIFTPQLHTPDALSSSPECPDGFFMETEAPPEAAGQDNLFCAIGQDYIDKLIIFTDLDRVRTDRSGEGKFAQPDFYYLSGPRCK
jgi:hypothetical protein